MQDSRPKAVYLSTSPDTIIEDYSRLVSMITPDETGLENRETTVAVDLCWHNPMYGVTSLPWQIDGVIAALKNTGIDADRIKPFVPGAPETLTRFAEILNRHLPAIEKHGLIAVHPEKEQWIVYEPKCDTPVLDRCFPGGIKLPSSLFDRNLVLLPTMKTHYHLSLGGSLFTLLLALFGKRASVLMRHLGDAVVEALALAREICPSLMSVMDGVAVCDGPGPHRVSLHRKGIIAASSDPLALDAVACHLMGFDPLAVPWIRKAHDAGLGTGDPAMIDIVGDDIPDAPFGLSAEGTGMDAFLWKLASSTTIPFGQRLAQMYDDWYWYTGIGTKRRNSFKKNDWGQFFETYRK